MNDPSSSKSRQRSFLAIWFGQTISTLGSSLTGFSLGIWIFLENQSVTEFALSLLAATVPSMLLSPIAGVWADRINRRWLMLFSDCGSVLTTFALVFLVWGNSLEVWHIYIINAVSSGFKAFQWPAYSAAIPQLVPKNQLSRANGMVQTSGTLSELLTPLLAGALMGVVGLTGVIIIDVATFAFAVMTLLAVRIPDLPKKARPDGEESSADGGEGEKSPSVWADFSFGWNYLRQRSGLLGILFLFFVTNITFGILQVLIIPLVLTFSTEAELGVIATVSNIGLFLGGLLMSTWAGPQLRVRAILGFLLIQGVFLFFMGGAGLLQSQVLVVVFAFVYLFCEPILITLNQVVWQSKVALEVQGRVFAMRRMISTAAFPLAFLMAGPLVDNVFKPWISSPGPLGDTVKSFTEIGPGAGSSLLIATLGGINVLAALLAMAYTRLRRLEEEIPDAVESSSEESASGPESGAVEDAEAVLPVETLKSEGVSA